MTEELKCCDNKNGKAKAKEPDTFNSSDPRKLTSFLLLCNLYFRNNLSYAKDNAKVTFALTYLQGMALDFFELALSWLDDWSAFVHILHTQFGPIDLTADAEDSIDNLKMWDNQHILKYNIDFNRLAIQTGWSNNVLRHQYYFRLAEQIKDVMGQQGKPANLPEMKTLVHAIDSHHWEQLHKKSCSDKPAANKDNKSQQKSEKKPKTSSSNSTKQNPSTSTSSNNNKLAKPSASSTSISNKLGKDGKLSTEECQRLSTTISVCTVVVLATRPLTARKQPPPLPRLKPMWLWSRKKKRRNHQKKAKQPSGLQPPHNLRTVLFLPVLLWRQSALTHLLFLILILSMYY